MRCILPYLTLLLMAGCASLPPKDPAILPPQHPDVNKLNLEIRDEDLHSVGSIGNQMGKVPEVFLIGEGTIFAQSRNCGYSILQTVNHVGFWALNGLYDKKSQETLSCVVEIAYQPYKHEYGFRGRYLAVDFEDYGIETATYNGVAYNGVATLQNPSEMICFKPNCIAQVRVQVGSNVQIYDHGHKYCHPLKDAPDGIHTFAFKCNRSLFYLDVHRHGSGDDLPAPQINLNDNKIHVNFDPSVYLSYFDTEAHDGDFSVDYISGVHFIRGYTGSSRVSVTKIEDGRVIWTK